MPTDPVLTVERKPISEAAAHYPLATRTGIHMLQHLINGDRIWSGCTKVQRRILGELCPPVIKTLLERGSLHAEDLPSLPETARSSTVGSLTNAGLVDNHRRITGKAVYAWYWAVGFKEDGRATEADSREVADG